MRASKPTTTVAIATVASVALGVVALASPASPTSPPTVPEGLTLVEVVRQLTLSQPDYLWTRPGDATGHTLFAYDGDAPGASKCAGDCAKEFPPLLAPHGAKAFGDWSLVRRADGSGVQWAYQTHPLYTWSQEKVSGEVATNVGLTETANAKLAEAIVKPTSLMPPKDWQVVRFTADKTFAAPAGIDASLVADAQGVVLTDYNGMTLYAFDGDVKRDDQSCSDHGCKLEWIPMPASELAAAVGEFSVVTRDDGSKQWAFRKHPLYRFSGDLLPGDVLGGAIDKRWTVAALSHDTSPSGVAITDVDGYGNVLALNGLTLYGGHAFQKRWGGRNLRDGYRDAYEKGKQLGTAACDAAKCLDSWHPFAAPADAQSHGFWEIFTRPDGTRQWAYKGFALYTYAGDKAPGEITGQATYDWAKLGGGEDDLKRAAFLETVGGDKIYGGAGIYWSITRP